MQLSAKFQAEAEEWARHCRGVSLSSDLSDYCNHPAYRELVGLGPAAVPLIMERYPGDPLLPWELVLQEITGVRMVEDFGAYDPSEARRRWERWWEGERGRYAPGGPAPGT
jgi:hypothetical protein